MVFSNVALHINGPSSGPLEKRLRQEISEELNNNLLEHSLESSLKDHINASNIVPSASLCKSSTALVQTKQKCEEAKDAEKDINEISIDILSTSNTIVGEDYDSGNSLDSGVKSNSDEEEDDEDWLPPEEMSKNTLETSDGEADFLASPNKRLRDKESLHDSLDDESSLDEELEDLNENDEDWLSSMLNIPAELKDILSEGSVIPNHLDESTLWNIIFKNVAVTPPGRKKLQHINTIEDVVSLIKKSKNILVLTGAGVSVSCGIPDFRSKDGVYARLAVDFPDLPDPQAMFDIEYFRKDPRPFFKFAKEIYPGQFKPSPGHRFIRNIEKQNRLLRNYTQNIDTLEQVAGITKVIQCHGSFATATCMQCRHKVLAKEIEEVIMNQEIPYCKDCNKRETFINADTHRLVTDEINSVVNNKSASNANQMPKTQIDNDTLVNRDSDIDDQIIKNNPGILKPDIVFFGEGLGDEFHHAIATDKQDADLLIMIGSSLKVRPVAMIPSSIKPSVPQILINRESLKHLNPDVELLGDCDSIINQLCLMLGEGWEDPIHRTIQSEITTLPADDLSIDMNTNEMSIIKCNEENKLPLNMKSKSNNEISITEVDNKICSTPAESSDSITKKDNLSLSERLPSNSYLFCAPNRYIFSGAEIYDDDKDSQGYSSYSDEDSDDYNESLEELDKPHVSEIDISKPEKEIKIQESRLAPDTIPILSAEPFNTDKTPKSEINFIATKRYAKE